MNKPKQQPTAADAGLADRMQEMVDWSNELVLDDADQVGTGMAVLAISQASAMAVQDAEAYMRNVMSVATAVYSAAYAEAVRNPESQKAMSAVIGESSSLVSQAVSQFTDTGVAACRIVETIKSVGAAQKTGTISKKKSGRS